MVKKVTKSASPKATKAPKLGAKKKGEFHVEISVNDTVTKFDVETIAEALAKFQAPDPIKTEIILTVTKGTRTKEEALSKIDAQRSFGGSAVAMELLSSRLTKLLTL